VLRRRDEPLILETPPWRAGGATLGVHAEGPRSGPQARRVIHGALKVTSGQVECLITDHWTAATYQACWPQVRQAWRGWHLVRWSARGSPHTARARRVLATALGLEVRWLPPATPECKACEGRWRGAKGSGLANRPKPSIAEAADAACRDLLDLTPRQRWQLAGVWSGHFWLAT
jgi:hypothetical protein